MATKIDKILAPGARVVIRDEEWIVRKEEPSSQGGKAVHVTGQSELVRGKEAVFLTELDEVRELLPEETTLVPDQSPQFRKSRLYIESLLRRSPPIDSALHIGHRAAMRKANYQLEPAAKALGQLRPRILMADGVGLGKTVEVGVLISELIRRGRGERILVVALKSILAQFQEELWARFTIPLVRLDSVGLQRVQATIPSTMNPFYYYPRVIISIDTLKKDAKYRRFLENTEWDIVVIDECQNVALRGAGSQRARLAQLLAKQTEALILTSATPHDGRPESFASLVRLLEPTAIADESNYTKDEVRDYFLRRFKKDIKHEVREEFHERDPELVKVAASASEDEVFSLLRAATFKTVDRARKSKGILFRTLLLKSFLSSPAALSETCSKRLEHKDLADDSDPDVAHDRTVLEGLASASAAITPAAFGKAKRLLGLLRDVGIGQRKSEERVVIFAERIATLQFLHELLQRELGLKDDQLAMFHGSLDDQAQKRLVRAFGTEKASIRVLLASDAASEGINLHFFCHRLIHFDLPWSLITLEQRNGRIDRFGQQHRPIIKYLLTVPSEAELQGDLRVLERLVEKEDMAQKNLGDTAWLMGLFDAAKEEERIAEAIERGEDGKAAIPDDPVHVDFLSMIAGDATPTPVETTAPVTLFSDHLEYARLAFSEIGEDGPGVLEWYDHLQGFALTPPTDLQGRYNYLPSELRHKRDELRLTTDKARVMDALSASREAEGAWPEWELLWELHPVSEWLADRVLGGYERHEAPLIGTTRGLHPGETVFLFQGMLSNRRGQPVLLEWSGLSFVNGVFSRMRPLSELMSAVGLTEDGANPSGVDDERLGTAAALIPSAVEKMREHVAEIRRARAEDMRADLQDNIRSLAGWSKRATEAVKESEFDVLRRGRELSPQQRRTFSRRKKLIEDIRAKRVAWVEQTMRTVAEPYIQLAAVLVHGES